MFLKDIDSVIGNTTTFSSSNEEFLKCPTFKQFLLAEDGLPMLFVGLDKEMPTPLAVNVPTPPGPGVIVIDDA